MGNSLKGFPKEVCVSSFRHGNEFTVVVVNPTEHSLACRLYFDGGKAVKIRLKVIPPLPTNGGQKEKLKFKNKDILYKFYRKV